VNIAADLRALLEAAKIDPPYLVGHFYGGVIVRQFLADYADNVFGMVLVDPMPVVNRFPAVWTKLLGDAEYADVVGLHDNLGITEEEYRTIEYESGLNEAPGGIAKELELMVPGNQQLNDNLQGNQLLRSRRLCVIFCDESNDFRKVYNYGVKHRHGTPEEREVVRKHLEDMSAEDKTAQRSQLDLSSNAQSIKTDGSRATHNVHMVDLEWVAQQILWVYDGSLAER